MSSSLSASITATKTLFYDPIQLEFFKDQITLFFKKSDGTIQKMLCSKANVEKVSSALKERIGTQLNDSKEIEIPEMSKFGIKNEESISLILVEYIEEGSSREFRGYDLKQLSQSTEKLADLFHLCVLLDTLDFAELKTWVEERILNFIMTNYYNHDLMKKCLMLAVGSKMNSAISASIPAVLAVYWESIDNEWEQRAFVNKRLLDKALANLNTRQYTSIHIVGYCAKTDSTEGKRSPIPKEICDFFPNLQAVKWYTEKRVPCVLYVEKDQDTSVLVWRKGSWKTDEGHVRCCSLEANVKVVHNVEPLNDDGTEMEGSSEYSVSRALQNLEMEFAELDLDS